MIALDPGGRELLRRRVATPQATTPPRSRPLPGWCTPTEARLGAHRHASASAPRARFRRATGRVKERQLHLAQRPAAAEDLEAALGREVRIANDANCFALSEATDGAAAGAATSSA